MAKWRHAKVTNVIVDAEPIGAKLGIHGPAITVTVSPTRSVVQSEPAQVTVFGTGKARGNVDVRVSTFRNYCDNLLQGIATSFVMIPAETTLNVAESVASAWDRDFKNLGRDMKRVIGRTNERRKHAD